MFCDAVFLQRFSVLLFKLVYNYTWVQIHNKITFEQETLLAKYRNQMSQEAK